MKTTPHIIAISGKQFGGKDTLCSAILEELEVLKYPRMVRQGMFDETKVAWLQKLHPGKATGSKADMVRIANELKKQDGERGSMIAFGGELRASQPYFMPEVVVKDTLARWSAMESEGTIITDLRLLHEMSYLQSRERAGEITLTLVRIEASREARLARALKLGCVLSNEDDATECELDLIRYWDFEVANEQGADIVQSAQTIARAVAKLFANRSAAVEQ